MKSLPSIWRPVFGGVVWLVALLWLLPSLFEREWAIALLLLSPLVLVPLGLQLAVRSDQQAPGSWLLHMAMQLQDPTALVLVLAFAVPEGFLAAVLSLPWMVTTTLIALAGLVRTWQRHRARPEEWCLNFGLIYLIIGGGWTVLARWGMRPLDFEAVIVLLTAIHFHYAGFLLPLLTGLAGRTRPGSLARITSVAVVAGVPLVAIGITTTQLGWGPLLECLASCLMALAGLMTAWLHLRLAVQPTWHRAARLFWVVAALSLAGSMVLAALYGCRSYFPVSWLDISWMRAVHGTANALGFGLAGIIGWGVASRQRLEPGAGTPMLT